MAISAPSTDPCWAGSWRATSADESLWAMAAASRTVSALPRLHPWRLGDGKGSHRTLLWTGAPEGGGIAALTQTSREPSLPLGDVELFPVEIEAIIESKDQVARWIGGMAQLPGAWLPPLAVLPRSHRDFGDPGTKWSTESLDFSARYTVHVDSTRYAADVLAPHVMALLLDAAPEGAAVTVAGDAVHVWVELSSLAASSRGLAGHLVTAASRLATAIPDFVLVDFPDRSAGLESDLAHNTDAARTYRSHRRLGHSEDPTLQRIYDQARATWEAGNVSSRS